MASLDDDFDAYADMLRRRNGVTLAVLLSATLFTAILLLVHVLEVSRMITLPVLPFGDLIPAQTPWANVLTPFFNLDDLNALHLSALTAQIATWSALRLWFTRQERMTTLLTHALVLEDEKDAAIKVLLHKDMND
jgi:hypothetical protein